MVIPRRKGDPITAMEINDPRGLRQRSFVYKGPTAKKLTLRTLDDLDMRNLAGQRAKHWLQTMVDELGGPSAISLARRTLLERAAFVRALLEHMEAERLDGVDISVGSYSNLVSTLHNLLRTVGLERVMKDVTPSLTQYLRNHDAATVESAPGREKSDARGPDSEAADKSDDA
ncbi:hypothetical protein GCM10010869_16460 [Mesorhizobium tianshanense]|uniref:Uncharacterized protein n=1 Tax=Mesorhizobium tianshanense TaxID=39844 RepID=A0A562NWD0_9HYPH|nr:hypothetical protein [Mesorhizobium tianshanense]TWI36403.1 hypothetical protein IQ26_02916 [Mesorhizobium tianshanense]GLS36057.1 hypothetical protein GCM10010869_16460 [Mesorhizobium tianshanense]